MPDLAAAAVQGVTTGKHFEAQRMLAEIYLQNKDKLGELSKEVKAALPDALYLASDVYLNKREKPAEAIPFLTELVSNCRAYKKRSGALFWLGAAYIRTGQREKATQVYTEIVETYPEKDHAIGAQQELVRLAQDSENFEEVRTRAEKLFSFPDAKARLYAILTYWRATKRLGNNDPWPLEMIAEFLATPGLESNWIAECEGIRDMITRTEQTIASVTAEREPIEPIPNTDVKLAGWKWGVQRAVIDDEFEKGNPEVALRLSKELVNSLPEGPEREQARWHAAKIYARMNRFDEAYEILGLDK